ncbi:MAG: helix-turn-helix domain-containing protein [Armatimonadota bacterium]
MYKMHMYRDGVLPVVEQRFHAVHLEVLRCSYWVLRLWNHSNLASPYWRLYWNTEAGAEVQWRGKMYPLDPDHLLLIAPNTPFTTRFHPDRAASAPENVMQGCPASEWLGGRQGARRVVHHLFTHFVAGPPYDAIAPQVFAFPLGAQVRELLEALIGPLSTEQEAFDRQQSLRLHALLHFALGEIPDTQWPAPQTDERVLAVMRFIDAHYGQPLTNADFVPLAAMSAKAFVRLFKTTMRQTPLAYLQQRRMENASILLHHTDESIERIAERCGFYDRHHFSKLFQRKFSVGPATYRKTRML